MHNNKAIIERNKIIGAFRKFGFMGVKSFYNVCKSVDVSLNSFDLVEFYFHGNKASIKMITKLQAVVKVLKYE